MSTLYAPRRRAEAFATLVDGPGAPTGTDGPLLALVDALRREASTDPRAVPRPAFVSSLRDRLVAEANTLVVPQRPVPPGTEPSPGGEPDHPSPWRPRYRRSVATAAVTAVLVGGGAGVANAAAGALPGEALYPVKRAIEQVQTGLAPTSAARGRGLLSHSGTRLAEADTLLGDRDDPAAPTEVAASLSDFVAQAQDGAALMLAEYERSKDPTTIEDVRAFVADQVAALSGLSGTLPTEMAPILARAMALLSEIDSMALALCAECSDQPPVQVPEELLGNVAAPEAPAPETIAPPSPAPAPRPAPQTQQPGTTSTAPPPGTAGGLLPPGSPASGSGSPATGGPLGGQPQPGTPPDSRPPQTGTAPSAPETTDRGTSPPDPSPVQPTSPGGAAVPSAPLPDSDPDPRPSGPRAGGTTGEPATGGAAPSPTDSTSDSSGAGGTGSSPSGSPDSGPGEGTGEGTGDGTADAVPDGGDANGPSRADDIMADRLP